MLLRQTVTMHWRVTCRLYKAFWRWVSVSHWLLMLWECSTTQKMKRSGQN